MAVLKVPRITTAQRSALLLTEGEIVFDVDFKNFYGGDGFLIGGFPLGSGVGSNVDVFLLTAQDILNKFVVLTNAPFVPSAVMLVPEGGINQTFGLDFTIINGNILSWDGLGLDNFLEAGERITVSY